MYDLATLELVMENKVFAIYFIQETIKNKYKGLRVDKRDNSQVEVLMEKNIKGNTPYRVIDIIQQR